MNVITVLVTIIARECNMVAMLYCESAISAKLCRRTFEPYSMGDSLLGACHVFSIVGINAMTSMVTIMTTDQVGSLKINHGMIPSSAAIKK